MAIGHKKRVFFVLMLFLLVSVSVMAQLVWAEEGFWTRKASMLTKRYGGFRTAVANGKLYIIGGFNNSLVRLAINEEYDPSTDTWVVKKPMPTPRSGFGVAVYQDKIYCIGGYTTDAYTGANEVYDSLTDTWEIKAPMPTKRSSMHAFLVDDRFFVIGGTVGYDLEENEGIYCGTNEVYDPTTDTWETKTPMPTILNDFRAHVVDGMIYYISGDKNLVYDTRADYWTNKSLMPIPIDNSYSVALDDRIYFFCGGMSESDYNQIYDVNNDTWTFGANLPRTLRSPGVAITSGAFAPKRIFVVGGMTGFAVPLDTNYVYDPEADLWNVSAPMPTGRYNCRLLVVEDTLYAIAGTESFGTGTSTKVEQYTPYGYIPEFPSWAILPVLLMASIVVILFRKRVVRGKSE